MDVQVIYYQEQETNQSPSTSGKRNSVPSIVDETLSIPTSPRTPTQHLSKSKSSSSGDDSLGSFRDVSNTASDIIDQLQETVKIFQDYKEERSTLDIQSKKDHIEILKHIQTFRKDLGDYKKRTEQTEQLYKILNDGWLATQQSEALINQKVVEAQNESKHTQQQLAEILQKIGANADLYAGVQQQYNDLKAQFDELCTKLTENQTTSLLLNKIMSTPRLNSAKMGEGATSETSQILETTLEDILTQQQQELLEMGTIIKQLNVAPKKEPDYHNIIDALRAQVAAADKKATTAQNNNTEVLQKTKSLMRWVQGYMTASAAAFLVSFWFWWQAHKA